MGTQHIRIALKDKTGIYEFTKTCGLSDTVNDELRNHYRVACTALDYIKPNTGWQVDMSSCSCDDFSVVKYIVRSLHKAGTCGVERHEVACFTETGKYNAIWTLFNDETLVSMEIIEQ